MKRNLIITLVLCVAGLISACGGGSNNDPNIGFFIRADRIETSQTTGTSIRLPAIMQVKGEFLEPQGTIQGTLGDFNFVTILSHQHFPGRKVPAKWRFTYFEQPPPGRFACNPLGGVTERNVNPGETEPLVCNAMSFPIIASPSIIDGQTPPSKIDIQAEGISNTHGAPQVAIFNERGELNATMPATIIIMGKGQVQVDTPAMNQFRNGLYQISISNVRADGSWDVIGSAGITFFNLVDPDIIIHVDPCGGLERPNCQY